MNAVPVMPTRPAQLNLQAERARLDEDEKRICDDVIRIGQRLDGIHDRPLRPTDSLSIRSEAERELVRTLVQRYRSLPDEKRQQLPALLNAVGKLEMSAGHFDAARQDFQLVADMVLTPDAKAVAHHDAYWAAIEQQDWDAALKHLREAVRLDPASMTPFPFDRFEPERILGAGGFGVAFLCRNPLSKGQVVVKTLRLDELDRQLDSVFQEAAVLEQVEHPAIIRLRDCGYADTARTRPYLVMDFFDGSTLERQIRDKGPLPFAAAVDVARQLAGGLLAAHGKGILHRDVKPANILIRNIKVGDQTEWKVKLIDFGLALRTQTFEHTKANAEAISSTRVGSSVAGTLDYAAPEQLGKLPGIKPGPTADIYGFARTMCFVLFGTPQPTLRQWKQLPSEDLAELLTDCLAEKPSERPQDFKVVVDRLQQLGTPGKVPPSPAIELVLDDRVIEPVAKRPSREMAHQSPLGSDVRERYLANRTAAERGQDIAMVEAPTKEEALTGGTIGLLVGVVGMAIYWLGIVGSTRRGSVNNFTTGEILGYCAITLVGMTILGYGLGMWIRGHRSFGFREAGAKESTRDTSPAIMLAGVFFLLGFGLTHGLAPDNNSGWIKAKWLMEFGILTLLITTSVGVVRGMYRGWKRQSLADVSGPLPVNQIQPANRKLPARMITIAGVSAVLLLVALVMNFNSASPSQEKYAPAYEEKYPYYPPK